MSCRPVDVTLACRVIRRVYFNGETWEKNLEDTIRQEIACLVYCLFFLTLLPTLTPSLSQPAIVLHPPTSIALIQRCIKTMPFLDKDIR